MSLAIIFLGCNKDNERQIEHAKWEYLNIKIISSLAEEICAKQSSKIDSLHNYIEIDGGRIGNEIKFKRFIEAYRKKENPAIAFYSELIDSIFTKENIDFFKTQYLVKKNYISLINETDCIKNRQKEFPNERIEHLSLLKVKGFGKILFTKDYKYGFLNFFDYNGAGFYIFKKNEDNYKVYKRTYTVFHHAQ
ncbi:hypothetical protein [uncultured Lacinutrix sp.]|uniref:hypothetical protein n=1 Tax=uncultured Lacinutrix sp. TaxID=574032 RepID=UPI0026155B50|nr:hypothetical protein [uncultured Lacinutrix sp.]